MIILQKESTCVENPCTIMTDTEVLPVGWDLKKVRKVKRFPIKIKHFLIAKFSEGDKSGEKCNPDDVASEMKKLRDSEGNRVFLISECLNSNQIASFFSRLVTSTKKFNKSEVEDLLAAKLTSQLCCHLYKLQMFTKTLNCDFIDLQCMHMYQLGFYSIYMYIYVMRFLNMNFFEQNSFILHYNTRLVLI